jgi:hypothetical protein
VVLNTNPRSFMIVQSNGADSGEGNSRKDGEKELERYMSTLLSFDRIQCLAAPSAGPSAQRSQGTCAA